jgi:hypothetical protein
MFNVMVKFNPQYNHKKTVKCECCGRTKKWYVYLHHKKSLTYKNNMKLPVFNLSKNKYIDSIVYKDAI